MIGKYNMLKLNTKLNRNNNNLKKTISFHKNDRNIKMPSSPNHNYIYYCEKELDYQQIKIF